MEKNTADMRWHNFLIWFMLWACAALEIVEAVELFKRASEGFVYPLLAVFMAALGICLIWIRFELAGYKAGAPKKLVILDVIGLAIAVIGIIVCGFSPLNVPAVIADVVMVAVNKRYYAKRESLFVN